MRRNGHKYGAIPTTLDGIRFDSKREAFRYMELKLLEKAGIIRDLEPHPKFPIHVAHHRCGELTQVCVYKADFRYREGPRGLLKVEDVKGVCTPVYKLKKKMVEAQYGIQITEIR